MENEEFSEWAVPCKYCGDLGYPQYDECYVCPHCLSEIK